MADYDIFGNIAILKGEKKTKKQKLAEAKLLLTKPGVKTVLEKATNVKGRLRTIKTKHLMGEKNLIAEVKENSCNFKLNVETCYFSPRLSNERQRIAEKIGMNDKVLVMFAGVGVYPIVIYRYRRPIKIVGVEIGKECCKYFKENLKLNKVPKDRIYVIQGDVKKKVNEKLGKFDVVIMARPNLKETFLKYGLIASKKGTRLFYYGFTKDSEKEEMIDKLKKEASELKRKIKIIETVPAGEIAPYKHRFRVEIKVLN
jgi:tRNA (guanine37-N1)-methyltransferase